MSSAISPLALPHSRALPRSETVQRTMTKTLTVILFLPFARLITSRNCPGLTGEVLVELCSLRSSGNRVSGIFPDIPRLLMQASGLKSGGDGRLVAMFEPTTGAGRPLCAGRPGQFGHAPTPVNI